ncbi:asparaginase [Pararhodobacter sp.]|uniref:asparaginase n=1 Tax=Pararhodobacter sp. TaxID=2127056 RepID=UPI002AFDFA12|nr:asparaginase [Pararhodobacter sp.]
MNRRVVILGAGGTIAMAGAHAYDWVDYGDTGIINPVDEIVAGMDFGLPGVTLDLRSFRMLPSTGITPEDWLDLAQTIDTLCHTDAPAGIVVTHGTATMEDTAFFLHLTQRVDVPVILTGAQRPPNTEGSDAAANMRHAIAVAASGTLPGGAYLVMDAKILPADRASKTANHALDAFEAPDGGPLGTVNADGSLTLFNAPLPRPHVFARPRAPLPRVGVVISYPGAGGEVVEALTASGVAALISAGFPPGRPTPGERAAMQRAAGAGVLVVQSSRAPRGRVPLQRWNEEAGILSGGGLSPAKARILVMLALAEGMARDEIQDLLLSW